LIVSDGRSGLAEATAEFFAKAQWQRFTVHRYRALEERSSTQANT
jgi:transposase-like protein